MPYRSNVLAIRAPNSTHQKIMKTMLSGDDFYVWTETMSRFGGHFCEKLADAIRVADSKNKEIIVEAFGHLVEKYGPGSQFARAAGFVHD